MFHRHGEARRLDPASLSRVRARRIRAEHDPERIEALTRHLDRDVALVDPEEDAIELRRDGEGRPAARVGVEHKISGVAQRRDQPVEQLLRLLRREARPLKRHGRDDPDVPHVPHGHSGSLLFGHRRMRAPSVRSEDRLLLGGPPSRECRGRERLEQSVESRFVSRVFSVAKEHVVHALEVGRLRGPSAVAPDDLACERLGAEDLVGEDLDVVAGLGVDVDNDGSMRGQERAYRFESSAKCFEVGREVGPAIVERDAFHAALPVARFVDALREKRRVEVRERYTPRVGGRERTQRHEVVALDEPIAGSVGPRADPLHRGQGRSFPLAAPAERDRAGRLHSSNRSRRHDVHPQTHFTPSYS